MYSIFLCINIDSSVKTKTHDWRSSTIIAVKMFLLLCARLFSPFYSGLQQVRNTFLTSHCSFSLSWQGIQEIWCFAAAADALKHLFALWVNYHSGWAVNLLLHSKWSQVFSEEGVTEDEKGFYFSQRKASLAPRPLSSAAEYNDMSDHSQ